MENSVDILGSLPVWSSILFAIIIVLVYKFLKWYRRYVRLVAVYDQFPHEKRHWLWGNVYDHPGPGQDGIDYQLRKCKEFPFLLAIWFSYIRCVIICNHFELAKKVLQAPAYVCPKPRGLGSSYELGQSWLGEGLLLANGQRWARNRKLLTPAFHFNVLKPHLKVANECTDILIKKIATFSKKNETFELYRHINLCSLDIITRCAFSFQTYCQEKGESHPYVHAVHRLGDLWTLRSLNPAMAVDWIYFNLTRQGREFARLCKIVHNFSEEIIKSRREELQNKHGERKNDSKDKPVLDFLDIILTSKDEDGNGLNDIEIRNEVDTFLFEGHDTTTSAMSFILLSLAEHPDIQEKCREEVRDILRNRETDELLWKDLPYLPFVTQCIKEGMRLHSPVFYIQRQLLKDLQYDKYVIPAGSHVAMDIHNMNHNELVWGKDHMEFKPERFSPENVQKMDPFTATPFSAGQRNCIGQNFAMNEMKVVIVRLIHQFRFSLKPGHVVKKRLGVVMRSENGLWVNAEVI